MRSQERILLNRRRNWYTQQIETTNKKIEALQKKVDHYENLLLLIDKKRIKEIKKDGS